MKEKKKQFGTGGFFYIGTYLIRQKCEGK